MEHRSQFESSGTKILMRRPIARELCVEETKKQTEKQTNELLKMNFTGGFLAVAASLLPLAKYSRYVWR